MFVRNFITLIVALFSSAVMLSPCYAQPRTEQVRYADLDLASPAGRAVLQQRIHSAAARVCETGSSELRDETTAGKCRQSAESAAIAHFPVQTASR